MGIGKAVARRLIAEGVHVVALDVNADALATARNELGPEFEPLVGGDAAVFVGIGTVCESKTKRPGVNGDTETLQKLFS